MPNEISWYIEKRVIGVRFYGDLTSEELKKYSKIVEEYISIGTAPLILRIDLREVTKFPTDFRSILHTASSSSALKTASWIIMLSHNNLFNFFGILASKVTHVPIRLFKTPEEADTFIAHNMPDLISALNARETSDGD